MAKRNPIFDVMKGITIILVILGHQSYVPDDVKHIIFAFHMPLFFFISGYFYHKRRVLDDVSHLIVPYLFTGLLLLFWDVVDYLPTVNIDILKRDVLKIFWGSGAFHSAPLAGNKPCIGAVWFLLALFWCKVIFGVLESVFKNKWLLGVICVGISLVSIFLDKFVIYLPMSLFPGLAALVFYYVGYCLKDVKVLPWYIILSSIVFFIVIAVPVFNYPFLSLVNCNYGTYPMSVIGAFGGFVLIFFVSKWLCRNTIGFILARVGQLTLPILCFHLFQLNTYCLIPKGADDSIVTIISSIAFPLLCTWVCSKIGFFRKIFGIKTVNPICLKYAE